MTFHISGKLLAVGSMAPLFETKLSNSELFSLSACRSKKNVVLFFYPKDFTFGCTREVCSLRDNYDSLLRHDVILLGVSFDNDQSHQAFIDKHELPFPLISDADRSIARAYGADGRFGNLIHGAKRITYVIDKKGMIGAVIHYEVFVGKHLEGIMDALQQIRSVDEQMLGIK